MSSRLTRLPVGRCAIQALLLGSLLACDAHVSGQATATPPGQHAPAPASASAPTPLASGAPGAAAVDKASFAPPPPPDPPIALRPGGKAAVRGQYGVVTTVEHNATHIGVEVLKKGGNAIDAAVAIAYALAVTHPSAGNIGGGGFMVLRLANGDTHAIDFRESAPAIATTERVMAMLKDDAAIGYRSPGVPGTAAGLNLARERFGTRPLAELMAPAIALARKGHKLGVRQGLVLSWAWPKLKADPVARGIFGRGKEPLKTGDLIKQPDLAKTLEAIAKDGDSAFYEGAIAKKIDEAMKKNGGYITADDLRAYKAKLRKPLRFSYRGFTVDTMPPPSMGGVAFADIMLTLERLKAFEAPVDSGLSLHMFVEASKRAYSERRLVGADPDFGQPEVQNALLAKLLDGAYLATRKPAIDRDHATPSTDVSPALEIPAESPQTTHFSVVDAAGNAVACTTTQSAGFGSKIVIPGTGMLLGNALGGFSETGVNTVAPGKRMASSMSPTIVTQNGTLALVLGSPGGDTIPNIVAQVFRNLVDYRMTIDDAVAHPRVHHQWMPDKVRVEKANPPPRAALDDLVKRGHTLDLDATPLGDANDILVEPSGTAWGYSDTREGGTAEGLDKAPALDKPPAR